MRHGTRFAAVLLFGLTLSIPRPAEAWDPTPRDEAELCFDAPLIVSGTLQQADESPDADGLFSGVFHVDRQLKGPLLEDGPLDIFLRGRTEAEARRIGKERAAADHAAKVKAAKERGEEPPRRLVANPPPTTMTIPLNRPVVLLLKPGSRPGSWCLAHDLQCVQPAAKEADWRNRIRAQADSRNEDTLLSEDPVTRGASRYQFARTLTASDRKLLQTLVNQSDLLPLYDEFLKHVSMDAPRSILDALGHLCLEDPSSSYKAAWLSDLAGSRGVSPDLWDKALAHPANDIRKAALSQFPPPYPALAQAIPALMRALRNPSNTGNDGFGPVDECSLQLARITGEVAPGVRLAGEGSVKIEINANPVDVVEAWESWWTDCIAITFEPASPPSSESDCEALIEKLGANDFPDREAAGRALTRETREIRTLLEAAADSANPEISARATQILEKRSRLQRIRATAEQLGVGRNLSLLASLYEYSPTLRETLEAYLVRAGLPCPEGEDPSAWVQTLASTAREYEWEPASRRFLKR